MKFMVQVRANEDTEAGTFPPNASEMFEAMDRFNQGLIRDGMLLAGDGLQPSSKGARIVWQDGKARVIDGPFAEAKELIAGYWMIEAASKDAVVQRFLQCPPPADGKRGEIEIRPVYGPDDFPEGVLTDEVRAHEAQWPNNKPKAAPQA
jgi:hypothetical protein